MHNAQCIIHNAQCIMHNIDILEFLDHLANYKL